LIPSTFLFFHGDFIGSNIHAKSAMKSKANGIQSNGKSCAPREISYGGQDVMQQNAETMDMHTTLLISDIAVLCVDTQRVSPMSLASIKGAT